MKPNIRILSFLLALVLFMGLLPTSASALSISDSGFTKIGSIPNDYVATQGMCTDGTYIYTFKMPSGNNNSARFYRTTISNGTTTLMKYTDNTDYINFLEMGHGNDMCAVVHDGVTYLYVTTMYHQSHSTYATHSIWKYQVTGATLKKVAYYDVMQDTTNRNFTGLTVLNQTDTAVTLLGANGANVYAIEIPLDQASGTVYCTKAFSINYSSAPTPTDAPTYTYKSSSGTVYYEVQGMTYDNGMLYYVLTASANKTPRRHNYIFAYDISDYPENTATRTAIADESIYVTSSTYSYFLEFESIDIYNGVMYFSANAGKSGYYENYDFCGKLNTAFAVTPEYAVTFCDENGNTLQSVTVREGETAAYTGATPTKAYDETNHYDFSTWLTAVGGSAATLTNVQADMTVYAGFTAAAHSYAESITTQPSCSAEGVKTFTCSCGKSYTEAISMTEHTPAVVNAQESTCSAEGYTGDTVCTVCNATLSVGTAIEKLAHTPIAINGKEASCSEEGYTGDTVCSVCSAPIAAGTVIAKTAHTPVVDAGYAASCTAEGLTDGSHCAVCNEILEAQTVIPVTEHCAEVVPGTPATCLNSGTTDGLQCADCGLLLQAQTVIPRLGHDYSYTDNGETHTRICSRCTKSSTEEHEFTDGVCVCGAILSTAPILDESILIQHSLNLASDISINYVVRASLLEGYDSYYLECVIPVYQDNVQTGTRTVTAEPVLKGNYYYFTLDGLNAISMNHMVEAILYMSKSGQAYCSNADLFSVATYAYAQLNQTGTTETLKALCSNLLRYGSLAQQYKNYCTDNLPDSSLTEDQKAYLVDLDTVTFDSVNSVLDDLTSPEITWVGKTMTLDSKVILKFVVDAANYAGNIDDLELHITYVNTYGETVSAIVTTPTVYQTDSSRYVFDFDGLLAAELRSALSVAVYMGEFQVSPTLEYSASSYGSTTTGILLSLCKSLLAYSDCAKAFFAG